MYDRNLDGKKLSFGVSGKLWKNVLIMYDRQTDTLWSHLTGEGLIGPLKGKRLKTFPAAMMRYAEWTQLYPDTLVLKKKLKGMGGMFRNSSRDPYEGYYYSSQTGVIPEKYRDNRLHPKTLLVALALDSPKEKGEQIAKVYPFADLNRAGVVNDRFAGRDVLVTYCEGAGTGGRFRARPEGRDAGIRAHHKQGREGRRRLQVHERQENGFALAATDRPRRGRTAQGRQIESAFHDARVLVRLEGLFSQKPDLSPLEITGWP